MARRGDGDDPGIRETLGLIGLGLLGDALAARFLAAGFGVIGWDIDEARRGALEERGGTTARDAADLAGRCERVVLCLPDSTVVSAVLDEIDDRLRPGQLVVDVTTGLPADAEAAGERLGARGVGSIDATVAGSSAQARSGEVVVMCGGDETHVDACRDILEGFARRVFHVGPRGSGSRMKLVVNLVLGLNRAVLAEGLAYAERCGMTPAAALAVLRSTAARSEVMETKGRKMVEGDFTTQARLAQHLKDVRLILETADRAGVPLPLSRLHADILEEVERLGHGDDDNSAVIRYWSR